MTPSSLQQTPLYERHRAAGAKMVPFGGWEMPLHYGSQLREHHQVRQGCGLFDISHMTRWDLSGGDARSFLRRILANDVERLPEEGGKGQYSLLLNPQGGVVDDLIVYRLDRERFRLVTNAATRGSVRAWLRQEAQPFRLTLEERPELAMLAVQGPRAMAVMAEILTPGAYHTLAALPSFGFCQTDHGLFIAKTGYTGEEGCEIILANDQAGNCWDRLIQAGAAPIGLGARDTLRLEAGLNLYGQDMDATTSPLESGLGWVVAWDRMFVGQAALEALRLNSGATIKKRYGLVLEVPGVLRNNLVVWQDGQEVGQITSGGFSPTMNVGIALARMDQGITVGSHCQVEIRGKLASVRVVNPPFVRFGQVRV